MGCRVVGVLVVVVGWRLPFLLVPLVFPVCTSGACIPLGLAVVVGWLGLVAVGGRWVVRVVVVRLVGVWVVGGVCISWIVRRLVSGGGRSFVVFLR